MTTQDLGLSLAWLPPSIWIDTWLLSCTTSRNQRANYKTTTYVSHTFSKIGGINIKITNRWNALRMTVSGKLRRILAPKFEPQANADAPRHSHHVITWILFITYVITILIASILRIFELYNPNARPPAWSSSSCITHHVPESMISVRTYCSLLFVTSHTTSMQPESPMICTHIGSQVVTCQTDCHHHHARGTTYPMLCPSTNTWNEQMRNHNAFSKSKWILCNTKYSVNSGNWATYDYKNVDITTILVHCTARHHHTRHEWYKHRSWPGKL